MEKIKYTRYDYNLIIPRIGETSLENSWLFVEAYVRTRKCFRGIFRGLFSGVVFLKAWKTQAGLSRLPPPKIGEDCYFDEYFSKGLTVEKEVKFKVPSFFFFKFCWNRVCSKSLFGGFCKTLPLQGTLRVESAFIKKCWCTRHTHLAKHPVATVFLEVLCNPFFPNSPQAPVHQAPLVWLDRIFERFW